jgi:hypothetical protein
MKPVVHPIAAIGGFQGRQRNLEVGEGLALVADDERALVAFDRRIILGAGDVFRRYAGVCEGCGMCADREQCSDNDFRKHGSPFDCWILDLLLIRRAVRRPLSDWLQALDVGEPITTVCAPEPTILDRWLSRAATSLPARSQQELEQQAIVEKKRPSAFWRSSS